MSLFGSINNSEPKSKNIAGVQKYLDISAIREGTVIMKNGSLKAVLMVSSINFALKSQEEQEAIIYRFQNFLNSLDFSVQIIISSRRLNIEDYYKILTIREREQANELLKIQIGEYRNFIRELVEMANIVSKTFYVAVSYSQMEELLNIGKGVLGRLKGKKDLKQKFIFKEEEFEKNRGQLLQRAQHVASGLAGLGLKMTTLNTQELIELFYTLYNPSVSEHGGLAAVEELDIAR